MSLYSGVKKAEVFTNSEFLPEGVHLVRIDAVKQVQSRKNTSKYYFIVEMSVLDSSNEGLDKKKKFAQVIEITSQMGPSHIKNFVAAVSGVEPDLPDAGDLIEKYWSEKFEIPLEMDQICELIVSDDQPLEQKEMAVECVILRNLGKNQDGEFTKHQWQPIEGGVL
jgi:hypothetical protein